MKDEKVISTRNILIFISSIILLWIILGLSPILISTDIAKSGQFADTFGAVNSLFSALAFGGLIYTILLQRSELQLQRLELIETRHELARSAVAQEKSEKALNQQVTSLALTARINTFNSLAQVYHDKANHALHYDSVDYNKYMGKYNNAICLLEDTLAESANR